MRMHNITMFWNYIYCNIFAVSDTNKQRYLSIWSSFVQTINQNQGILHKVCRIYCHNQEDHNDLFQEIVLQLWKAFPSFRNESKISTGCTGLPWIRPFPDCVKKKYKHGTGKNIFPFRLKKSWKHWRSAEAAIQSDWTSVGYWKIHRVVISGRQTVRRDSRNNRHYRQLCSREDEPIKEKLRTLLKTERW